MSEHSEDLRSGGAELDPKELLGTFDQYDPAHVRVMHEVLAHARRECPVFHTEAAPGYWVVSRYADAKKILFDTATFSNRNGVTIQVYLAVMASLLVSLWTGSQPTKRTFEMLCLYFSGWASAAELLAHLEKLHQASP